MMSVTQMWLPEGKGKGKRLDFGVTGGLGSVACVVI